MKGCKVSTLKKRERKVACFPVCDPHMTIQNSSSSYQIKICSLCSIFHLGKLLFTPEFNLVREELQFNSMAMPSMLLGVLRLNSMLLSLASTTMCQALCQMLKVARQDLALDNVSCTSVQYKLVLIKVPGNSLSTLPAATLFFILSQDQD